MLLIAIEYVIFRGGLRRPWQKLMSTVSEVHVIVQRFAGAIMTSAFYFLLLNLIECLPF